MVGYETPAQSEGLGTYSGLKKNADPIQGEAMLVPPALDLALVAVRLPADLRDLTSAILQHFDCCSYTTKARLPGGDARQPVKGHQDRREIARLTWCTEQVVQVHPEGEVKSPVLSRQKP